MTLVESLISPEYLESQRWLHAQPRGYGGKGDKWADVVRGEAVRMKCDSILDYGCGQGSLERALRLLDIVGYDPAIPGKDMPPFPADLVVCTDVLEHVEPEKTDAVVGHIFSLARKGVFLVVSLEETDKKLPDGRNAHINLRPALAWQHLAKQAAFRAWGDVRKEIRLVHTQFEKIGREVAFTVERLR